MKESNESSTRELHLGVESEGLQQRVEHAKAIPGTRAWYLERVRLTRLGELLARQRREGRA